MPITTSGRIVKTKKVKKGTAHQKNHRWESFTSKISKLSSLDPIRRVRRHDIEAEDISTRTSYLNIGLEKWQELNMSEGFVSFSRELRPMCDSLPHIIHFEDEIMEAFVVYIGKRERESLEPLLELITDFAHDLGPRFEKHYGKALGLVTSIAGTTQEVEVTEWSFTSLAFMFKYLSKLLVADLRPTYDLMAPLLGKNRQRPHIARFAAEAMSFLVRKAGAPANIEKALPLIVGHAKTDLGSMLDSKEYGLYYHGLMTMFAEAMKGNGLNIHTSGPNILRTLIWALDERDFDAKIPSPWVDLICGTLTSLIHHSSSDTFKEVMALVLELSEISADSFSKSKNTRNIHCMLFFTRILGITAGVRKGTRVNDWPALLKSMSNNLIAVSKNAQFVREHKESLDIWNYLIFSVSIALQYSPMDALIPFISPFMESLTKDPLAKWFLTFCSYLSEAEPERFRTIALPYFQRFVPYHVLI